jgi:hypothetical protein
MAFGKSKGTSKQRQTNDTSGSTGPDAQTQGRVDEIYGAAQGAANAGVPGAVSGASDYYSGAQGYGAQGEAALGGDAAAAAKYMNPYQQQVVDAAMTQFGVQNKNTENQMNDAATRAGAFGGSRHGVATGVALGENQRNQGQIVANLLGQGFEGAMGRAAGQAGRGMDAAGAGANLGMTAGSPDLWRMNVLKQGFSGTPYGTTYKGRGQQDMSGRTSRTDI